MKTNKRSGQAAVEYILIAAMVVGIIGGVVAPMFQKRIVALQDRIGAESSSVISQKTMGIPIGWFFGGANGNFSSLNDKFDAANPANADATKAGDLGTAGKDGADGKDEGKDGDAAKGGSNAPIVNNPNAGGKGGGKGNGAKAGKGGAGGAGDEGAEDGKTVDLRRGGGGGGGNTGFGGGSEGSTQKMVGPDGKEIEVKVEPNETPAEALKRRLQEQSRTEESRTGGCQSMNLFTILKIVAVIVLIVIGAAVALTGKGNKGSD